MRPIYIPLGAACDSASALKILGLRNTSLPFDWLWNLDSGLSAITDMLKKDFEPVMRRDAYARMLHYRFPDPQVVYKEYPSIVHLHSNPLIYNNDHEALVRRFMRFRQYLRDPQEKVFLYYRCFEEDRLRGAAATLEDSMKNLLQESGDFIETLLQLYPEQTYLIKVIIVLEASVQMPYDVWKSKFKGLNTHISGVGHALTRNDNNNVDLSRWRRDWEACIINFSGMAKGMQMIMKVRCATLEAARFIKSTLSRPV